MCSAQNTYEELLELGDACSFESDSCNQKAIDYYTKAISLNSRCAECYYNRATRKSSLNLNSNDIIFDYQKAIEFEPTELKYYREFTFYCWNNNEINLALQYCYLALKYFNNTYDNESESVIIGTIELAFRKKYSDKNSFELTIPILDSLIITNPNKLLYYELRAENKYWSENYEGALADFLYIIKNKNYDDVKTLQSIASCYNLLSNYFEAIQYYNKVIKIKEEKESVPFDLSYIYQSRGDCKSALKDHRGAIFDYEKAISINSGGYYRPQVYNSMAYCKMKINDFKGALISLNKAIEDRDSKYNDNVTAYSYYLLGFVKNSLKDKEGACLAWSKSGELGYLEAYNAIQDNCK